MFSWELLRAVPNSHNLIAQTVVVPEGTIMENLLTYSPVQHQLISHLLTLGVSAMAVGFVYFITTNKQSSPRFQPSSTLSAVVMVSAFLILGLQLLEWLSAFAFDGTVWGLGVGTAGRFTESTFSNGYRYLNWSIDVPCLLAQMLFVIDVTPGRFRKLRFRFITAGLLMIYTGYIGQYFEITNTGWFLFWGAVSTVFYVYILYMMGNLIFKSRENLPRQAYKTMGTIWWLILISWTLYPLAYLVPWAWKAFPAWGAWAAVTRQFLYTMADIFSKVVYGVLLSSVAQTRSAAEGYEPAIQVQIDGGAASREFIERNAHTESTKLD
ncbi:bacteriorhodopsin [Gloeocapsopsis dulcis]|nr:bacteriorhodopsin [Gloeocapsopsis dulcis]WNN90012.1 bacteriorhodopsin [Gloeocapsopsis dulcis]